MIDHTNPIIYECNCDECFYEKTHNQNTHDISDFNDYSNDECKKNANCNCSLCSIVCVFCNDFCNQECF